MDLIEFIGFVISILALLVIATRRASEERRRRRDPEAYEKEQEERRKALRQSLREMHIDLDDEEEEEGNDEFLQEEKRNLPPPLPKPITKRTLKDSYQLDARLEKYQPKTTIEDRHLISNIENRDNKIYEVVSADLHLDESYQLEQSNPLSIGGKVLKTLPSMKEMIILNEILNRPLALRTGKAHKTAVDPAERSWE